MSDPIGHECGLALVRLKQPLHVIHERHQDVAWGLRRLHLLMEKQRNRGQDGGWESFAVRYAPSGEDIFHEAVEVPSELVAPPQTVEASTDLLRRLSLRDPVPACDELRGSSADLVWIAETVEHPPWAGMRAAACVVSEHAAVQEVVLVRWVTDPALAGLGRVVAGGLDAVPADVALRLATAALEGPEGVSLSPPPPRSPPLSDSALDKTACSHLSMYSILPILAALSSSRCCRMEPARFTNWS